MAQKRHQIPIGYKVGYLEYLGEANDRVNAYQKTRWCRVMCVCGKEKEMLFGNFFGGNSRSCGCMSKKLSSEKFSLNKAEEITVTRDLYMMRKESEAADRQRVKDIEDRIKLAEVNLDYPTMMEWTLFLLERKDKLSDVIRKEEKEMTVGDFVFEN